MTVTAPSVIVEYRAALVTDLRERVPSDVAVWPYWPGPTATRKMIALGNVRWSDTEHAESANARVRRKENPLLEWWIWVFNASGKPHEADVAEVHGHEVWQHLSDALAENWKQGIDNVQSAICQPGESSLVTHDSGWAIQLNGTIDIVAHLQ